MSGTARAVVSAAAALKRGLAAQGIPGQRFDGKYRSCARSESGAPMLNG
jgi:hypothetical protein